MDRVSGPYITFVDTRDHDNTRALVASAVRLVNILKEEGIKESKVVVSVSDYARLGFTENNNRRTDPLRFPLPRQVSRQRTYWHPNIASEQI